MFRLLLTAVAVLGLAGVASADDYDWYVNKVLEKVPSSKEAKRVKKLTHEQMVDFGGVLRDTTATLVVVKTNKNRWAKLLLHPASQKISPTESTPILLIDRFLNYKDGTEREEQSKGADVRLFNGFIFNLELGQVVPSTLGGDIRFVVKGDAAYAEPIGKAELYLIQKPLPAAKPGKTKKLVVRDPFIPQYYNGAYKLYDDGRRTGELHIKVRDNRDVVGHFFSGRDGKKYEVSGKVGDPHHKITFRITLPRTVQFFHGWMFTADGKTMTGYARMLRRETGFYAVRIKK